jgi:thiol-disulfide isomerase/thioredoxin
MGKDHHHFFGGGSPWFPGDTAYGAAKAGLEQELARLGPGQYAVVFFSAPWCGFCREFKPKYTRIASEANGQYLFLTTESEVLARQYNITAFPTLMIIGSDGTQYVVSDPNNLANEMTQVQKKVEEVSSQAEKLQTNM